MPRKPNQNLYDDLIRFIQRFTKDRGYAPTYREMLEAGFSCPSMVLYYLRKLVKNEMIVIEASKSRTVKLTEKGRYYPEKPPRRVGNYFSKPARINAAVDETIQLKVIGRTFAGQTTPIPNNDFDTYDEFTTIEVSELLLPSRPKRDTLFALEVSGESMIEAGINDGDYIICQRSETAKKGDMVVALLQDLDETTLKYYFPENGRVRLQPANSTMEPIIVENPKHLMVQGVVIMVLGLIL